MKRNLIIDIVHSSTSRQTAVNTINEKSFEALPMSDDERIKSRHKMYIILYSLEEVAET